MNGSFFFGATSFGFASSTALFSIRCCANGLMNFGCDSTASSFLGTLTSEEVLCVPPKSERLFTSFKLSVSVSFPSPNLSSPLIPPLRCLILYVLSVTSLKSSISLVSDRSTTSTSSSSSDSFTFLSLPSDFSASEKILAGSKSNTYSSSSVLSPSFSSETLFAFDSTLSFSITVSLTSLSVLSLSLSDEVSAALLASFTSSSLMITSSSSSKPKRCFFSASLLSLVKYSLE